MKLVFPIFGIAGLELWWATSAPEPFRYVLVWFAAVTATVGCCYILGYTQLFGKRPDGTFPVERMLLFWPWMNYSRLSARVFRKFSKIPPVQEVLPGWWIGGWPDVGDLPEGTATLDMTCELFRRTSGPYHCVPTWDGTAPALDALIEGARWAALQHALGRPVVVHCAHGKSRSATALTLALVIAGQFPDVDAAYAFLKSVRAVNATQAQRAVLASAMTALASPTSSTEAATDAASDTARTPV